MSWIILGVIILGGAVGALKVVQNGKTKKDHDFAEIILSEYRKIKGAAAEYFKTYGSMPASMSDLDTYLAEPLEIAQVKLYAQGEGVVFFGVNDNVAQTLLSEHGLSGEQREHKLYLLFRVKKPEKILDAPIIQVTPEVSLKTTTFIQWAYAYEGEVEEEQWENQKSFYEEEGVHRVRLRVKTKEGWSNWAEKELIVAEDKGIKMIGAGLEHFFILRNNGTLYGSGGNAYGQLGHGKRSKRQDLSRIENISRIKYISAGADYSLCVSYEGFVYGAGRNHNGQLGLGHTEDVYEWSRIDMLQGVQSVFAGHGISAAITENGKLYLWGRNEYGQINDNGRPIVEWPYEMKNVAGVQKIAIGTDHLLVLHFNGQVSSWGVNKYGQLGDGERLNREEPFKLSLSQIVEIACGNGTSFALDRSGTLYAWGKNTEKELANVVAKFIVSPMEIRGMKEGVALSAGVKGVGVINKDQQLLFLGFRDEGGGKDLLEIETVDSDEKFVELEAYSNAMLLRTKQDDIYLWDRREMQRLFRGNLRLVREAREEREMEASKEEEES